MWAVLHRRRRTFALIIWQRVRSSARERLHLSFGSVCAVLHRRTRTFALIIWQRVRSSARERLHLSFGSVCAVLHRRRRTFALIIWQRACSSAQTHVNGAYHWQRVCRAARKHLSGCADHFMACVCSNAGSLERVCFLSFGRAERVHTNECAYHPPTPQDPNRASCCGSSPTPHLLVGGGSSLLEGDAGLSIRGQHCPLLGCC